MLRFYLFYVVFLQRVLIFNALHMPTFIPTCRKSDPDLNACALKNARLAIPELMKGSKTYNIPSMTPLDIPRIDIQAGNNLNVELTNNKVSGLDKTLVKACNVQPEKNHMEFRVLIPRANIIGHYKMNGRILILPIAGEGAANITFIDGDYNYSLTYILKERNKRQYAVISDHNITFTTKRAYYNFENLFSGNKQLADETNKFLNENWADVTKDLGSTVGETISSIITSLANSLFSRVPYNEVLPP